MRIRRLVFLVAFILAVIGVLSTAAFCESDQSEAERALGPQWRQLSQRAGMVFAATVLSCPAQNTPRRTIAAQTVPAWSVRIDHAVPSIALRFRVDRAIAGVEPGQILTIHEWIGAQSFYPPMRRGDRVLLFLYPPSRLGLTSPIGGLQGQVQLDAAGRTSRGHVTVDELERAIRSARGE
ncbi:MAG: hypothetical protein WAL71_06250 [Terriglobales bacterium]|jgi:hypothetical protein